MLLNQEDITDVSKTIITGSVQITGDVYDEVQVLAVGQVDVAADTTVDADTTQNNISIVSNSMDDEGAYAPLRETSTPLPPTLTPMAAAAPLEISASPNMLPNTGNDLNTKDISFQSEVPYHDGAVGLHMHEDYSEPAILESSGIAVAKLGLQQSQLEVSNKVEEIKQWDRDFDEVAKAYKELKLDFKAKDEELNMVLCQIAVLGDSKFSDEFRHENLKRDMQLVSQKLNYLAKKATILRNQLSALKAGEDYHNGSVPSVSLNATTEQPRETLVGFEGTHESIDVTMYLDAYKDVYDERLVSDKERILDRLEELEAAIKEFSEEMVPYFKEELDAREGEIHGLDDMVEEFKAANKALELENEELYALNEELAKRVESETEKRIAAGDVVRLRNEIVGLKQNDFGAQTEEQGVSFEESSEHIVFLSKQSHVPSNELELRRMLQELLEKNRQLESDKAGALKNVVMVSDVYAKEMLELTDRNKALEQEALDLRAVHNEDERLISATEALRLKNIQERDEAILEKDEALKELWSLRLASYDDALSFQAKALSDLAIKEACFENELKDLTTQFRERIKALENSKDEEIDSLTERMTQKEKDLNESQNAAVKAAEDLSKKDDELIAVKTLLQNAQSANDRFGNAIQVNGVVSEGLKKELAATKVTAERNKMSRFAEFALGFAAIIAAPLTLILAGFSYLGQAYMNYRKMKSLSVVPVSPSPVLAEDKANKVSAAVPVITFGQYLRSGSPVQFGLHWGQEKYLPEHAPKKLKV